MASSQISLAQPVLSVCIPTYERVGALAVTLDALALAAAKCAPGEMEICVSDNASKDGTYTFLEERAKKTNFLRINRNPENIGAERNKLETLKMARGTYCWIIGDDDSVLPNGVASLVKALRGRDDFVAGFIAAGRPEQIADVNRLLPKSEYSVEEFIEANIRVQNEKTVDGLLVYGFLPSYLFSRKAIEGNLPPDEALSTGWYHLSLFFHSIATHPEGSILVHHDPPVRYGAEGEDVAKVCMPDRDIRLYTEDRLKAITISPVRSRLEEPAKYWLKNNSGYWYMLDILRLMFMRPWLKQSYYDELKKDVYAYGDKMYVPPRYFAITRALKLVAHIPLFRDYIARAYAVRSRYAPRFEKYSLPALKEKGLLRE